MDSKLNRRILTLALIATVLSGAAFYLSTGLEPLWWPMWLAALPVLWIAPRLPWWAAALGALVARAIGGLSTWTYYLRLQFPLWLRLEALLMPAIAFSLAMLLFRGFLRRGNPWLAIAAVPACMVAYEYLTSLVFGTFGNTAYTQMNNLPVLQLGAWTGLWGIGFIVMLFAPMIAAALLSQAKARRQLLMGLVAIFGCAFGYGAWRLGATPAAEHTVVVGLAASDLPKNIFPQTDQDAMQLMHDYAGQVAPLAGRGARIVVLPEMTAVVHDSISGEVDKLFDETAHTANAQIVLGVLHVTSTGAFNEARLYSGSSVPETVYRKHHLVPVLEGRTTPGDDISVVSQAVGKIGLEICRDMDYPEPARRYGREDVGLLLVPAWDFDIDRLWHGHMALMRGIENGFSIVRSAKQGLLTVSDDRGRVLTEARTTPNEEFTTLVASVPVRHDATLYQQWGDWFAWLDLAGLAVLLVILFGNRLRTETGSGG